MNQQHSSSATISNTRSNKRLRGGNTERKDNGISQNAPPTVSTDDNKRTNGNDVTLNLETTHTTMNTNRADEADMTISHNGNSKRQRSRSNSTGHPLPSTAYDLGGSSDTVDRNNNEAIFATNNSTTSNVRRKVQSQVPQMTEDYVELASHMMLHPLSQIRAANLIASGQLTIAIDSPGETNGAKNGHNDDNDAVAPKLSMTPQSQYLVHMSALGYLKSAIRQPTVIEKWSPYEIAMFEASIAEHGKNFARIQKEIGMTKSVQDVIEFYYIWKKTSHYAHWKKEYIPEYLDVDLDE